MHLPLGTSLQGGKYKIIRVLGQGGFGITYEAEQVSLNRVVALKEFFMKDCCERAAGSSHMTVGTGNQQLLVAKFRDEFIKEAKLKSHIMLQQGSPTSFWLSIFLFKLVRKRLNGDADFESPFC